NPDLRILAGEGFLERDLHIVAKIGAALAPRAAAAPAAHAEQVFEDIGESRGEIGAEAVSAATAALLEGSMAEAIIGGTLVAVLEHFIGFVEFAEFVLAFGVTRIAIRVMLHGELAERGLQLDFRAGARDTEHLVIVALRHTNP